MFEGLLPAAVRWAVAPADVTAADLLDAEVDVVAGAAPVRARDFAAGRVAAREALAALGLPRMAILADDRLPRWPAGIVGSITHCTGLAAAAVARAGDLRAIGIDAEPAVALGGDVVDVVSTAAEHARLDDPLGATVVFCAKEAFYKCWSSTGGALLEFADVELELAPDGCFLARPPVGGEWAGRWAVRDGFVVTASWVVA